jgi:hypothetical protein
MNNLYTTLILCFLISCSTKEKVINEQKTEDKNVNLYAFVGKKIAVNYFNPNDELANDEVIDSITGEKVLRKTIALDLGFRCKYIVLKNVFNNLEKDTIEFVAYDHYGRPNFENSEYVLLYLSKSTKGNHFFHQKYQYDHLEKNYDGEFFGYSYTIKRRGEKTFFKKKRKASLEELFSKKKNEVFTNLF